MRFNEKYSRPETRSDIVSEEVLQFVITATINRVASLQKEKVLLLWLYVVELMQCRVQGVEIPSMARRIPT
jgi:hypothetical protein